MTFWEAFNSGKKFKLPKGYGGQGSWCDNWSWQKVGEDSIQVGNMGIYSVNECIEESRINLLYDETLMRISEDWYTIDD